MSVVMIMEWPGVTKEQYEQTRKLVKWETDIPQGAMFHVATFDENGLRVVDLWQSAEAFQSFVDKRLMPGVQQAGIQGEPKVEIYPAHALFTPGFRPV